ncbi:MAG: hypothetical protein U0359_17625 [Byssovorax sp.]
MRRLAALLFALTTLTTSTFALAEQGVPDKEGKRGAREGGGLLAGAKFGGIIPFGGLSPNITGAVEVGYVAPWLHRSFAVTATVDYAAPQKSGSESDPRVTGGTYTWHLTTQELNVMPVLMYRMTFLGRVTPYVGVGPRIYFLKSTVRSNEGTPSFSETTEQSMKVGVGIPLGAEFQLGPGGITGELLFQYGTLDHVATGASNTGGLNILIGYRFLL